MNDAESNACLKLLNYCSRSDLWIPQLPTVIPLEFQPLGNMYRIQLVEETSTVKMEGIQEATITSKGFAAVAAGPSTEAPSGDGPATPAATNSMTSDHLQLLVNEMSSMSHTLESLSVRGHGKPWSLTEEKAWKVLDDILPTRRQSTSDAELSRYRFEHGVSVDRAREHLAFIYELNR